jgi:hypothetical protein
MSRPADIPAEARVRQVLDQYLSQCHDNGKRPSVLGLAARIGLNNTTLRRHFPQHVKEISQVRSRCEPSADAETPPGRYEALVARNARLRRANQALTGNLKLAAAQIQHLGVENTRLRQALEASSNVSRIGQPGKRGGHGP